MPDAPPLAPTTLPNVDLQGYTPPSYKPLNQSDISAVTNPPPPVFKASNTDVQAVSGTQMTVVPATPPVFGPNPAQAQTTQQSAGLTNPDGTPFPDRVQAVDGKDPSALIIHHTSGRSTIDGLKQTLSERGLGVEFAADRDGKIYQIGDSGASNILPGWGPKGAGLNNRNIVGIEVIANDDKDVTPAQVESVKNFAATRYGNTPVFGHGEVNPGHKEADEGMTIVNSIRTARAGGTQPATTSASGTSITPGQPSSDPGKLQIGPSGPIPAPPVPGLTATDASTPTAPADTIKQLQAGGLNATHYGYANDPNLDPESAKGNGAYVPAGGLVPGYDVALNAKAAAMVGNPKPGEEFQYAGRTWRFGDVVPEKYSDARFDIYDPKEQFSGSLGGDDIAPTKGALPGGVQIAGDQAKSAQPAAFGMRVATPQDAAKYDQYIQQGGDPNQVPVYDRLAVAIAKDPNFLTKPENFEEFYGLVYKPLKAQTAGEQFNSFMTNLGPGLWQTTQNLGAAAANAVVGTYDQAKLAFQNALGKASDYNATEQDLAQRQASMSAGIGQGVSDAFNFVSGTMNGILSLPQPILDMAIKDPAARDEMDRTYAQNLQYMTGFQQKVQGLSKGAQDLSAAAYGIVGMHKLGQEIGQATPDPNVVQGTAMLANPLNVLPVGEGLAAVGAPRAVAAFKPIFSERVVNLGEEAAAAAAKKAALDSVMVAPSNVMDHAANPGFSEAQNVRAQFAPQQAAAGQAAAQTQSDLATQLTRLGKTEADPGTATGFMSQAMQTGGNTISNVAGSPLFKDPIENLSNWMSGGNPLARKVIYSVLDKTIFGALLEHMGPLGSGISAVIEHGGEVGEQVGHVMSAMGKELGYGQTTLPYWTRVAQQTKYMPQWAAAALDSPLVQTAGQMVKGGAVAAGTQAALGAVSNPLNPMAGALGGALQGGFFGMAGAGMGQWQRFQEPGQYLLAARGDWKRYRDSLPVTAQKNFDQLSPANQLIMGQAMQHFPGLETRYVNQPNGPRGNHFIDAAGRGNITINLANPESAIAGILSHELIHNAATHGQLPGIYDQLLGNPNTGFRGQYTHIDPITKEPILDPQTGRYKPNQEFNNLSNQYTNALGQSGVPTSHLGPLDIAKEIYAEHGVDYLLSGGAVQDANSAFRGGLYSEAAMKTAMAKIGFTFDDQGNLQMPTNKASVPPASPPQPQPGARPGAAPGTTPQTAPTVAGTGLFQGMQRNPALGKLASSFFQKKFHEGAIESENIPNRKFGKRDLAQDPNIADGRLQNAPEIQRDTQGNAIRDPLTGQPVYRTPAEVKEYNANFAAALQKGIDSLTPEQRAQMGHQTTTEGNTFVRYLPSDVLDAVALSNQYNPHQIADLRMLSNVLSDQGNPGMEVNAFYHKALTANKKYGQFEGKETSFVPYGIEVTKDGNVNVKAVNFNQLNDNYLKARNRGPYKDLWSSPSEFMQDAHQYFVNHSEGRPGADGGLGEAKRDAINSLGKFETIAHKDSNPLVETMPRGVKSIIKSYRIDRTNQMQATGAIKPFISQAQYDLMNTNYLPKAKAPLVKAPAEMRQQTPERQQQIADTQAKAQAWLKDAGPAPQMSTETYLNGDRSLPKMANNQELGEYINANHPHVDVADPVVREQMAHAFTYDVMSALSKDGNALGWYDDTVDRAMNEVSKVNPAITASPKNEMMFKLGLAVTSQGQKVHPNFESAYHVFNHFDEHGVLPEDRADFGPSKGGKDAPAMEANFAKINRLHDELGTKGLSELLNSNAKAGDLARRYNVNMGGDAADEQVVGSKILGPKVGAFFANLNKNFNPITMDLWLARGIHRMSGEMFKFSESAYREQISALRDQINNGEVPEGSMSAGQQSKILRQIDALEKMKDGKLTRQVAQTKGKAIDQWAQSVHDAYKKNIPGRGSYKDGTPAKRTAKSLDEGVNKISDDPGGVQDRTQIKDIYARVQDNMKDSGIDITNADLQALTWYREQKLFDKAGVLGKGSDNVDYLDGAYALGQKYGYGHKGSSPADIK